MHYFNYGGHIYPGQSTVISKDNRAFRYGEGLIETMLWEAGGIRLWDYHYKRLLTSATSLDFDTERLSSTNLSAEIRKTVGVNNIAGSCIIRLQLWNPGKSEAGSYLIECLPAPAGNHKMPVVGIATSAIKCFDSLSHIKSASRLPYIAAQREAGEKGWDDALLLNQYGRIAESTICNIFCERDGVWYTPPLTEGCIAGVFRQYLLDKGMFSSFRITESALSVDSLAEAEKIYLANAVRGIIACSLNIT